MGNEDYTGRRRKPRESESSSQEVENVRRWLSFLVVGGFVVTTLFLTVAGAMGLSGVGPDLEDLEEARRRYLEPLFATEEDLLAAATDRAADEANYEASVVWKQERETTPA